MNMNESNKRPTTGRSAKPKPCVVSKASSMDMVYASEVPEFFYEGSGDIVPEGEPVGLEFFDGKNAELVLFADIYFESCEPYSHL